MVSRIARFNKKGTSQVVTRCSPMGSVIALVCKVYRQATKARSKSSWSKLRTDYKWKPAEFKHQNRVPYFDLYLKLSTVKFMRITERKTQLNFLPKHTEKVLLTEYESRGVSPITGNANYCDIPKMK